jgi:uncharacterized surface protein with fasciclin (FAS1) repeats
MIKIKPIFLNAVILLFLFSCTREPDIYTRPDWLEGKVYTQVKAQPELTTFTKCIELTGYDEILDVSGSYTIFAPSDEAFKLYLSQSGYTSVENIPIDKLTRLVKYHIVQNPWSKVQLRTLDVYGWIDTLDINNDKPRGFKRETLLLEPNRKYGIKNIIEGTKSKFIIVDTLETNKYRRVITDSRKFVPIYYQEYFNIYNLKKSDYQYYFNRTFDSPNDIYYAEGKIVSDEIAAENGFVYVIDRVVEPLDNAAEILDRKNAQNQYTDFLDVLNMFPKFDYNSRKTNAQPGADQGLVVDSLFDLSFPELAIDFNGEKTSPPTGTYGLPSNVTIRYHHGLMAPTNQAFQKFVNQYIKIPNGWGSFENTPEVIKRIVANTYLSVNTIYPSDFQEGFYNGEKDIIRINEGDIIEKEFGSNCSFLGLKEAIVPRALKSVTGPIYLLQGYNKVMNAVETSGLLSALKREGKDYMLFVENDVNTSRDSSLLYDPIKKRFSVFMLSPGTDVEFVMSTNDLRTLLLSHVATEQKRGVARKEFILNLAGSIIIVNNVTGEVSGTDVTTIGYRGTEAAPNFPVVLSDKVDNGTTYDIQNWFSFSSPTLFGKISTDFPKFHALLKKAGLTVDKEYRYNFVSDNENYTVFVPTDKAIDDSGLNSLPIPELKSALLLHFVQGQMIFTDGRRSAGYYETARIDEKSTNYTTIYTSIYIQPGIDFITIPDKAGSVYTQVVENGTTTNLITGVQPTPPAGTQPVFPVMYNNGVIHVVDKVLDYKVLNTK